MNEKKQETTATNEVENLIDGKSIPVLFNAKKAKESGATGEELFIRKIPIFDMEPLGRTFGKYVGEAALYCDRDEAYIRGLDEESFSAVLETGRQLNFTSFKRWWGWQEATLDALGQTEDRDALIARVVEQLQKPGGKLPSVNASSS